MNKPAGQAQQPLGVSAVAPKRQRASGRVTLSDVAASAGVSPMTASRALRGERAVAPDLIARVVDASKRLNYVPDPAARALATQRSDHIVMLIPKLSNALFVDLLDAAQQVFRAAGFQTLIGVTHYDPAQEEQLVREQLLHRPAGLLITGLDHSAATEALIASSQVPCVHLMDLPPPDQQSQRAKAGRQLHCVGFHQYDASVALARHLLTTGRKRLAFAAAQLDPRLMQRLRGWRDVLSEAGVYDPALEWLDPTPSSIALGAHMLTQIMRDQPSVDAIFFCNDDLAQGALLAALRLGIDVPNQVAIAGFNDLTGSDQMLPSLTTVRTPRAQIGEMGASMLLNLVRKGEPSVAIVDLGFELIIRGST